MWIKNPTTRPLEYPPDSRYGVKILIVIIMLNFFTAYSKVVNMFLTDWMAEFGVNQTKVSLIPGSLCLSISVGAMIWTCIVQPSLGTAKGIRIAIVKFCLSLLGCSYACRFESLLIGTVTSGISFSWILASSGISINRWFVKYRIVTNQSIDIGKGAYAIVIPYIVGNINVSYGWRVGLRFLAVIPLVMVFFTGYLETAPANLEEYENEYLNKRKRSPGKLRKNKSKLSETSAKTNNNRYDINIAEVAENPMGLTSSNGVPPPYYPDTGPDYCQVFDPENQNHEIHDSETSIDQAELDKYKKEYDTALLYCLIATFLCYLAMGSGRILYVIYSDQKFGAMYVTSKANLNQCCHLKARDLQPPELSSCCSNNTIYYGDPKQQQNYFQSKNLTYTTIKDGQMTANERSCLVSVFNAASLVVRLILILCKDLIFKYKITSGDLWYWGCLGCALVYMITPFLSTYGVQGLVISSLLQGLFMGLYQGQPITVLTNIVGINKLQKWMAIYTVLCGFSNFVGPISLSIICKHFNNNDIIYYALTPAYLSCVIFTAGLIKRGY